MDALRFARPLAPFAAGARGSRLRRRVEPRQPSAGDGLVRRRQTWSAKAYKRFIFTGDMLRGFDVFRFAPGHSEGLSC